MSVGVLIATVAALAWFRSIALPPGSGTIGHDQAGRLSGSSAGSGEMARTGGSKDNAALHFIEASDSLVSTESVSTISPTFCGAVRH